MKKIIFLLSLMSFNFLYCQESISINRISPNAKFRSLNILINVIYDVTPSWSTFYLADEVWAPAFNEGVNNESIPTFLLDIFDTIYNPNSTHGFYTRVFGESSFDSLQITGDYVVVNVLESRILAINGGYGGFCPYNIAKAALDIININGLQTVYGHNSIEDYFRIFPNIVYCTNIYIRNIHDNYGQWSTGKGSAFNILYLDQIKIGNTYYNMNKRGTTQSVGTHNFAINPTSIVVHEISHLIFGGMEFHASGGNHRGSGEIYMPFFGVQGGYGLMGAAGSSLVGTNAYERWRLNWKNWETPFEISARDSLNNQYLNSDIQKCNDTQVFILRDFITTGDAIRIKLPYKDSEFASNQYIWLENHQIGKNNKLDFLQSSNVTTCRPIGKDGIYSYYQIGRDIKNGPLSNINNFHERDNLKIISAEGFWDYSINEECYLTCGSETPRTISHSRCVENPFNGTQDQEEQFFPLESDSVIKWTHIKEMERKKIGMQNNDSLPWQGDERDAFQYYSIINVGTNPSTCNTKTFYNVLYTDNQLKIQQSHRNNQTTYLTGLSIEMIPLPDSTYRVNIRWDDYDVRNDAIWTGNICLKESLYLNNGKTIYLKQNKTVALPFRNPGTGYFADFTNFRCDQNSIFILNNNSELNIDEKSIFEIDTLASFTMSDSSLLHITGGSSLTLKKGGNFKIYGTGTIIIDSLSTMTINDTIFASNFANIIVKPGGLLILDNGVITNLNSGLPWKGIKLYGHKINSQNGSNTKQGIVIVRNSSIISNAICGIKVGDTQDPSKNGGIIYASETQFKNCKNAVLFAPYKNINNSVELANRSKFTDCEFIVDNNFYTTGMFFDAHVKLLGVNGISFTGCSFTNTQTTTYPTARRYASSGISSFNSGFTVRPKCLSNLIPGEICNQNDIDVESSFTGLDYGIVAQGGDDFYKITVLSSKFNANDYGIYLSGVKNAKILKNSFVIGKTNNNLVSNPVGLYILGGSGFRIEENVFQNNSNSTLDKIGIQVKNTGNENNQIYKNLFESLTYGQIFDGINYSTRDPYAGLISLCNENTDNVKYDFWVRKIFGFDFNGINQYQGILFDTGNTMNITSAGNKFSSTSTIDLQYNNDANYLYYLYNPNNSDEILSNYTSATISPEIAPENLCPSKINGLYPLVINSELTSITLDYANLKYNYNQLIDAGNTEELIRLIQDEWSEDIWNLRIELLGKSPYLSQEAIVSVAQENLLPPALLLEICLANPDATRDQGFLDILRYGIPTPLPEYMINLIIASWDERTLRTEMEEQLSAFKTYRDEYQNYKTEFLLSDSIVDYSQIKTHLETRGEYVDFLSLSEIAISQNNFQYATLYMDILENSIEKLTLEESTEVSSFKDYISIRESIFLSGKTIYNLDSTQIASLETYASSNNYRGAILARNILCFLYDICIEDVPAPPKMLRIGSNGNNNQNSTPFIASVKVMPNPAHEYASFIWDMKSFDKSSILYIYDQNGKIIETQPIDTKQGQWVWNIKNVPNGVYVYTLKSDQLILYSGKIIVNK